MRFWSGWQTLLVAGTLLVGSCTSKAAEPVVATIPVTIKGQTVQAELARTQAEQELGLMFRTSMPADRGMLFVFPRAAIQDFWMKDTKLPLSIAYIDADKVITNIDDMQPLDEITNHRSSKPVLYALEVNQGWFAARGIVAGDKVEFTLPAPAVTP
jgi:uncharacterized membrane protein (UPF0127 family)